MQVNRTQSPSFGRFHSEGVTTKSAKAFYSRIVRPIVKENKPLIDSLEKKGINLTLYLNNGDKPSFLVGAIEGTRKFARFKDGTQMNVGLTLAGMKKELTAFIEKAKEII